MTVQDRISFFFVFSASSSWSLWPILSANSSKSPPKWCVISNHFSLSLTSHPNHTLVSSMPPQELPNIPLLTIPWLLSFPSCPTAISQILKDQEVLSLPFIELFCCLPGPTWSVLLSAFLWSQAHHSMCLQPLASSSSCKFFPASGSVVCCSSFSMLSAFLFHDGFQYCFSS